MKETPSKIHVNQMVTWYFMLSFFLAHEYPVAGTTVLYYPVGRLLCSINIIKLNTNSRLFATVQTRINDLLC